MLFFWSDEDRKVAADTYRDTIIGAALEPVSTFADAVTRRSLDYDMGLKTAYHTIRELRKGLEVDEEVIAYLAGEPKSHNTMQTALNRGIKASTSAAKSLAKTSTKMLY